MALARILLLLTPQIVWALHQRCSSESARGTYTSHQLPTQYPHTCYATKRCGDSIRVATGDIQRRDTQTPETKSPNILLYL